MSPIVVSGTVAEPSATVVVEGVRASVRDVTFTASQGGGTLDGSKTMTIETDSDGRVLVVLTLGPQEGFDSNVVQASVPGLSGLPAAFIASGWVPKDPADTRISGVVFDNSNNPIAGVTMRVQGTGLAIESDDQCLFEIKPAPVGHVVLIADGSTARREGVWPKLEFEMVPVAGNNNTIGMQVHLLPLDIDSGMYVDETTGGTLTLEQMPGFSLTVEPGSATFPDGSRSGLVSVTLVHADKIPMVPNFGQQPRFIVTIQPAGVIFDPPAPITVPNVDFMTPGEVTEMYSFDHDLGQFVSIGTGTVSEDGTVIQSDPGVGIIKGSWHCGGNPTEAGSSAVLTLTVSPEDVFKKVVDGQLVDAEFTLTAKGTPPRDGEYSWKLVNGDSDVVGFMSQPPCSSRSTCEADLVAKKPGEAMVRVTFTVIPPVNQFPRM